MTNENVAVKTRGLFSKLSKIFMWLSIVLLISVIAGVASYFYYKYANRDVVAVVGKEKITKTDYKEALYGVSFDDSAGESEITAVVKEQVLQDLVVSRIVNQEAAILGLSVSDEEIMAEIQRINMEQSGLSYEKFSEKQKKVVYESARSRLLKEKVLDKELSSKEGGYVAFNFHKYVKDPLLNEVGSPQLLQKQKDAAKSLVDRLVMEMRAGAISLDEAREKVINDSNVGKDALLPRTPTYGSDFSVQDYRDNEDPFDREKYKDIVRKLKQGEVSDPVVDTGKFGGVENVEYRYVVFMVTKATGGDYDSYDEWLSNMKNKYTKTGLLSKLTAATDALAAPSQCAGACSSDNADFSIKTRYMGANGTRYIIQQRTVIQAGPSSTPLAVKDGASCSTKIGDLDKTTNATDGESSLCMYNYSFYCTGGSAVWLKVYGQGNAGIAGVGTSGVWKWDIENYQHDGMMNDNDSSRSTDSASLGEYYDWGGACDANDAPITLKTLGGDHTTVRVNISDRRINGTLTGSNRTCTKMSSTMNGETVNNTFVWYPNYYTITYDGNGNTAGTVEAAMSGQPNNKQINLYGQGSLLKTGYEFLGWSTNKTSTTADHLGGASFTMPGNNVTLYAVWGLPAQVNISVVSDPPGASVVGGGGTFTVGETISPWRAESHTGSFLGWTGSWGDFSSQTTEYWEYDGAPARSVEPWSYFLNVVVPAPTSSPSNQTITAHFSTPTSATLSLVANPSAGGTVSGGGSFNTTTSAQSYTAVATASAGYVLSGWSGGAGCPTGSFAARSTQSITCTANFTLNTYTITPSSDTGCSINPSTPQTVPYGGSLAFSGGSGNAAYAWNGYSIDGGAPVLQPTYTFSNVLGSHTIRAKCTLVPTQAILNVAVAASGGGTVSGGGSFNTTLTDQGYEAQASPNSGYHFVGWSSTTGTACPIGTFPARSTETRDCIASFDRDNTAPTVTLVSPVGNPTLGQGPATVDLVAFSVDDGGGQVLAFQLYDPNGNLARQAWMPTYVANNAYQTFQVSGLNEGIYRWRAQSYDGSLYSAWAEAYFTIPAPPVPHNLSCTVSPEVGGASPLVVKVTVSPTNVSAPYSYRMDAVKNPGDVQSGKPGVFYFTYSATGSYQVQVFSDQVDIDPVLGKWRTCTPPSFDVKTSTSSSGGEVAQ